MRAWLSGADAATHRSRGSSAGSAEPGQILELGRPGPPAQARPGARQAARAEARRGTRRGDDSTQYDAFLSYSHMDEELAVALQSALQRFAKPWRRRRALWVFRDDASLAVNHALWSSIRAAMDRSRYLIVLASPQAAASDWIDREIRYWLTIRSVETILPVLTAGDWAWSDAARGFDPARSSAVPPALRAAYREEPRHLDMRQARQERRFDLRYGTFRSAVADLAAPLHGKRKEDLESEDLHLFRRARSLRASAVTGLCVLAVAALVASGIATIKAREATEALADANHSRKLAEDQEARARTASEKAALEERRAEEQRQKADRARVEAVKQGRLAAEQEARAEQAAAEAQRQEELAGAQSRLAKQAKADAAEQQRLAAEQRALADDAAREAKRQKQLAIEQERRAKEARAEAERQQRLADEQRRLADAAKQEADRQRGIAKEQETIATARRIVGQATLELPERMDRSLLLSLAAVDVANTIQTRGALLNALEYEPHLIKFLQAEGEPVTAVAATDHIRFIAAGDRQGRITIWDVRGVGDVHRDPVRLGTIPPAPGKRIAALAFAGEERLVSVRQGADSSEVVIWDVARRQALGQPIPGRVFALSEKGTLLAISRGDRQIELWDLAEHRRTAVVSAPGNVEHVNIPHYSSTALEAAVDDDAGTVLVTWDETYQQASRHQLEEDVRLGGLHPDGGMFAGADGVGAVRLWTMTGDLIARLPARERVTPTALTLGWELGGAMPRLVVGYSDGGVQQLERTYRGWEQHDRQLRGVSGPVSGVALAMHRGDTWYDRLVTGNQHGQVLFWEFRRHYRLGTAVQGLHRSTGHVVASSDGKTFFQHVRGEILQYDPRDLLDDRDDRRVAGFPGSKWFALHPNGKLLATVAPDTDQVVFWDVANQERRGRPIAATGPLEFSPDGEVLASSAPGSGKVLLWDVERRALLRTLPGSAPMRFGRDGTVLAVTDPSSNGVTIWNLGQRPTRLASPDLDGASVLDLAVSPDGATLAAGTIAEESGRNVNRLVFWDLREGRQSTLETDRENRSLAFSPDGRTIAAADGLSTVLWDVKSREAGRVSASVLYAGDQTASYVAFRPGGDLITSGPGTVVVWDMSLASWRAKACALANRNLTHGEWSRYIGPDVPYKPQCPDLVPG